MSFIGRHWEHDSIRKSIIVFGTLFNNIYITRPENQAFKVPIEYGPREKFLGMTQAKPDEKKQAIILPRMSFEFTGMQYDVTRKIARNKVITGRDGKQMFKGQPWNISFELNVIAKTSIDVTRIVSQILPSFNPDYVVDVRLVEEVEHYDRIPIVYNSVEHEDIYEGNFQTRRVIIWKINFTMKTWLYGPLETIAPIKKIDIRFHGDLNENSIADRVVITPGLTANGQPTSDPLETIEYQLIDINDDWGIIEQYTEGWDPTNDD